MTIQGAQRDDAPADALVLYALVGLLAFGALMATAFSPDPLFRFHGWIFVAAFVTALSVMTIGLSSGRFRSPQNQDRKSVV